MFLTPEWVTRYWGNLFDIDFIAPDALLGWETLTVMKKPQPGSPPRMTAKIVDPAPFRYSRFTDGSPISREGGL